MDSLNWNHFFQIRVLKIQSKYAFEAPIRECCLKIPGFPGIIDHRIIQVSVYYTRM